MFAVPRKVRGRNLTMKNDRDLQRHVLEELDWEPEVNAAHIGVTVDQGIITLTGHVPAYSEKLAAGEVAKRIHGVRGVANDIEVEPGESHRREDEELAAAARHALEWNSAVPSNAIQLTVSEGWISLDGTVERQRERVAAARAVSHLKGARGITNNIVIAAQETNDDVKGQIESALRRSATINSRGVSVECERQTVVLTGDVHSHAERDEAERIAWSARGVVAVENCLTITPWGSGPAEEWGY